MNEIRFPMIAETEGYIPNDEHKLVKVQLTKQIPYCEDELLLYYGEGENDWVYSYNFYASVTDYKNGDHVTMYKTSASELNIPSKVYRIEDGRVKSYQLCEDYGVIGRLNENKKWEFEVNLEGEYYTNYDVARGMADVVVIENGQEHTQKGVLKRLMLTDEQRKAVKALGHC